MNKIFTRCVLSSAIALLAACGGDDSAVGGQSSLNLNITDAPVDNATAVVVEFTGVSIKKADQEEPIVFTFDEPKSIDLLALQGASFDSLLEGVVLDAGDYPWVRLHVNAELDEVMDSYIELEDGTMKELYIPGGSESGLKIKTKLTIVEGEESDYTIDFDLRKSLRMSDEDEAVMLKPSLRMVNDHKSGHMHGIINDELISEACAEGESGAVYVYAGADVVPADYSGLDTDPVASSLINLSGEGHRYELGFLEQGTYTIAYTCDAALDTPDAVESLVFLSTANVELQARKSGRSDFHSKGGNHSGRSDGRNGRDGDAEGRHRVGMSEEERAAKQAEWDALTEEEKAALQAEWEAKRAEHQNDGRGLTEEERAAKMAEWDALTEEEKAAKQAEWDAKKEEYLNNGRGDRDESEGESDEDVVEEAVEEVEDDAAV